MMHDVYSPYKMLPPAIRAQIGVDEIQVRAATDAQVTRALNRALKSIATLSARVREKAVTEAVASADGDMRRAFNHVQVIQA